MTYRVHGMMQSYSTRKMTGYLDYKGIPWCFRRFGGMSPQAMSAGFPGGTPVVVTVHATEFMRDDRATLLARYRDLRCDRLDAVLARAGIHAFFSDAVAYAGTIPDYRDPPRPALNRPFPPVGR